LRADQRSFSWEIDAGQGIANPIGMIWSGAMMLEHLGEKPAAASIVAAIERTLGERTLRTREVAIETCQRVIDDDSNGDLPAQSDMNTIFGFLDAHAH
jgi:hypothetical protein